MRNGSRRIAVAAAACLAAGLAAEAACRAARRWGGPRPSPEAFQVYGVGESTADGQQFGARMRLAHLLGLAFGGRIAGLPVEEIDLAHGGESILPQAVKLYRVLGRRRGSGPGVVLIYSGNNDFGYPEPSTLRERAEEAVLYRSALLTEAIYLAEKAFPSFRIRDLAWYEFNMRRAVELARAAGLTPVLFTVVSNVADMEPGVLVGGAGAGAAAQETVVEGSRLEASGRYEAALRLYQDEEPRHPELAALLEYRMGKCLRALGRPSLAAARFQSALDIPVSDNFGRATGWQNGALRALAREYAVPLVDAERLFEDASPQGLVGSNLIGDGQHPLAQGYVILANGAGAAVAAVFRDPGLRPFRDDEDLYRRTGYTRDDLSDAYARMGHWLLGASLNCRRPSERLALARARFERSIAFKPDNFAAWLGLGLTEAAARDGHFLTDPAQYGPLGRYNLFFGLRPEMAPSDVRLVASLLRRHRVPAALLARIESLGESGAR